MTHAGRRTMGAEPRAAHGQPVAAIENPQGHAPLLLICEHASNTLPPGYDRLGLPSESLDSHIAWDPGALGVARGLSRLLDAPLVHATVSRLLLDLNRDPAAPDSIPVMSESTHIPGNVDLDPGEREWRVREIYEAFHGAIDAYVEGRQSPPRAVVSVHSFTPVYRGVPRPWDIGLIFDGDERFARFAEEELRRDPALCVGMNQPYSPADRVFHTLDRHAARRGLAPLMIEIRNDLIRTEDGQESWAKRLAPLLREGVRAL